MKQIASLQSQVAELPSSAEEFVQRVMLMLKMHDAGTFEHCMRVGEMTMIMAQELKLNFIEKSVCLYAGMLHDVGKVKVPAHIINKPDKLTAQEYDIMKMHTRYGVEMIQTLQNLPFFQKVSEAILYHHERVDGQGYFKLHESKIPHASKIILVVDTVDAMTQDRPYRKGCSLERAYDELVQCSGTQFDSTVVDAYLKYVEKKQKVAA